VLRVGATPQVMETVLAGFLPGYRRRHPVVEVHLIEDGGVRLPGRPRPRDFQLGLIVGGDPRFSLAPAGSDLSPGRPAAIASVGSPRDARDR